MRLIISSASLLTYRIVTFDVVIQYSYIAPVSSGSRSLSGERTVKRLRLSKALTMPDSTTVLEACQRMAACRVDAALLTDSNALLCGILTDKVVITISSFINFGKSSKFRHLPVVENGEVIALLDIAKCLYDAISRLERTAEKGKAIQVTVEGAEKNWRTSISGPGTFIEALRERVMTPNPDCRGIDISILDALHTMRAGKFLHLPLTDRGKLFTRYLSIPYVGMLGIARYVPYRKLIDMLIRYEIANLVVYTILLVHLDYGYSQTIQAE
ncbi:hypothetical protein B296_00048534 [Ensete ventricosum]|uniref:CBS domain-containing protein n=1 Tax=Ensete ventricosum TaxID=4639 RepID=A0A426XGH4_ENSVE|nr:hypothetical protein B296_00048534 [Ensete ventricosum]